MELYLLILLVVALAAGFLVLYRQAGRLRSSPGEAEIMALRHRLDELTRENSTNAERARILQENLGQANAKLSEREQEVIRLNTLQASLETANKGLIENLEQQKALIGEMQEKLRIEFRNLAGEILDEKTLKFTQHNKEKLQEILAPLGEKIQSFQKKVEETYDRESKERFSLEKEIRNLSELNQQISREATNLTRALKGQAKTQGNWGEIILESILEKSGLTKDREFFIQQSFTSDEGRRLQPDVVVAYPGDRHIVIDSKVSLVAYERYASSEAKEEQEQALREHLLSVRNHITELSGKNYQDIYALKGLDFVMLFMPVEPAYLLAMQHDPNLWSWAYDRRILLISPTNLIAALRMIANLWRVEYQNKNAMEIARQSGDLYDKFTGLLEDLKDIGLRIEATRKSYDAAMGKLATGKGNLIRRVEGLRTLGARAGKEIPRSMLDRAEEEET